MTFDTIMFREQGAIAWLTLNRPDRLNAICRPMLGEISQALDQAAEMPGLRALIVTGADRAFCAGQDLTEPAIDRENPAEAVAESLDRYYHPVLRRMRALQLPVVAAVNGVAAGAGANFALNCDIVIAAASATFVQAFTRIGLVPDCGGTWLLPRLVGPARARALMILAEPLTAAQAEDWGLIYRAVEDDQLLPEAERLAKQLAEGPTSAYGMIKHALDAAATNDLGRQLDLERDLQARAAGSRDFREGVTAFKEKRAPSFSGR